MAISGGQTHRIARLSLRLSAPGQEQALGLRARLREQWPSILPGLDERLGDIVGGDDWLHIPRLEIRFRLDGAEDLDDLPGRVAEALAEEIREKALAASAPSPAPLAPSIPGSAPRAPHASRTDSTAHLLESLIHFLERGNLPWHCSLDPGPLPRWREYLKRECDGFFPIMPRQPGYAFIHRLLPLLEPAQILALIDFRYAAMPEPPAIPSPLAKKLALRLDAASPDPAAGSWLRVLLARLLGDRPAGRTERRHAAISGLPPVPEMIGRFALDAHEARLVREYALPEPLPRIPGHQDRPQPADAALASKRLRPMEPAPRDGNRAPDTEPSIAPGSDSLAADTAMPLACAGMVLFHPYIPRFFSARGIDYAASGIAEKHIDRAAALLSHVASGSGSLPEYRLGGIKMLLGMEPGAPLPPVPGLIDAEDRSEADLALAALISHWTALGRMSPAGLRESFLKREGRAKSTDRGWSLGIERTGYDILLDRLPYPISLVKLPWMPRPIHVDW